MADQETSSQNSLADHPPSRSIQPQHTDADRRDEVIDSGTQNGANHEDEISPKSQDPTSGVQDPVSPSFPPESSSVAVARTEDSSSSETSNSDLDLAKLDEQMASNSEGAKNVEELAVYAEVTMEPELLHEKPPSTVSSRDDTEETELLDQIMTSSSEGAQSGEESSASTDKMNPVLIKEKPQSVECSEDSKAANLANQLAVAGKAPKGVEEGVEELAVYTEMTMEPELIHEESPSAVCSGDDAGDLSESGVGTMNTKTADDELSLSEANLAPELPSDASVNLAVNQREPSLQYMQPDEMTADVDGPAPVATKCDPALDDISPRAQSSAGNKKRRKSEVDQLFKYYTIQCGRSDDSLSGYAASSDSAEAVVQPVNDAAHVPFQHSGIGSSDDLSQNLLINDVMKTQVLVSGVPSILKHPTTESVSVDAMPASHSKVTFDKVVHLLDGSTDEQTPENDKEPARNSKSCPRPSIDKLMVGQSLSVPGKLAESAGGRKLAERRTSSLPSLTVDLINKFASDPPLLEQLRESLHYHDNEEMRVESVDRVALHAFVDHLLQHMFNEVNGEQEEDTSEDGQQPPERIDSGDRIALGEFIEEITAVALLQSHSSSHSAIYRSGSSSSESSMQSVDQQATHGRSFHLPGIPEFVAKVVFTAYLQIRTERHEQTSQPGLLPHVSFDDFIRQLISDQSAEGQGAHSPREQELSNEHATVDVSHVQSSSPQDSSSSITSLKDISGSVKQFPSPPLTPDSPSSENGWSDEQAMPSPEQSQSTDISSWVSEQRSMSDVVSALSSMTSITSAPVENPSTSNVDVLTVGSETREDSSVVCDRVSTSSPSCSDARQMLSQPLHVGPASAASQIDPSNMPAQAISKSASAVHPPTETLGGSENEQSSNYSSPLTANPVLTRESLAALSEVIEGIAKNEDRTIAERSLAYLSEILKGSGRNPASEVAGSGSSLSEVSSSVTNSSHASQNSTSTSVKNSSNDGSNTSLKLSTSGHADHHKRQADIKSSDTSAKNTAKSTLHQSDSSRCKSSSAKIVDDGKQPSDEEVSSSASSHVYLTLSELLARCNRPFDPIALTKMMAVEKHIERSQNKESAPGDIYRDEGQSSMSILSPTGLESLLAASLSTYDSSRQVCSMHSAQSDQSSSSIDTSAAGEADQPDLSRCSTSPTSHTKIADNITHHQGDMSVNIQPQMIDKAVTDLSDEVRHNAAAKRIDSSDERSVHSVSSGEVSHSESVTDSPTHVSEAHVIRTMTVELQKAVHPGSQLKSHQDELNAPASSTARSDVPVTSDLKPCNAEIGEFRVSAASSAAETAAEDTAEMRNSPISGKDTRGMTDGNEFDSLTHVRDMATSSKDSLRDGKASNLSVGADPSNGKTDKPLQNHLSESQGQRRFSLSLQLAFEQLIKTQNDRELECAGNTSSGITEGQSGQKPCQPVHEEGAAISRDLHPGLKSDWNRQTTQHQSRQLEDTVSSGQLSNSSDESPVKRQWQQQQQRRISESQGQRRMSLSLQRAFDQMIKPQVHESTDSLSENEKGMNNEIADHPFDELRATLSGGSESGVIIQEASLPKQASNCAIKDGQVTANSVVQDGGTVQSATGGQIYKTLSQMLMNLSDRPLQLSEYSFSSGRSGSGSEAGGSHQDSSRESERRGVRRDSSDYASVSPRQQASSAAPASPAQSVTNDWVPSDHVSSANQNKPASPAKAKSEYTERHKEVAAKQPISLPHVLKKLDEGKSEGCSMKSRTDEGRRLSRDSSCMTSASVSSLRQKCLYTCSEFFHEMIVALQDPAKSAQLSGSLRTAPSEMFYTVLDEILFGGLADGGLAVLSGILFSLVFAEVLYQERDLHIARGNVQQTLSNDADLFDVFLKYFDKVAEILEKCEVESFFGEECSLKNPFEILQLISKLVLPPPCDCSMEQHRKLLLVQLLKIVASRLSVLTKMPIDHRQCNERKSSEGLSQNSVQSSSSKQSQDNISLSWHQSPHGTKQRQAASDVSSKISPQSSSTSVKQESVSPLIVDNQPLRQEELPGHGTGPVALVKKINDQPDFQPSQSLARKNSEAGQLSSHSFSDMIVALQTSSDLASLSVGRNNSVSPMFMHMLNAVAHHSRETLGEGGPGMQPVILVVLIFTEVLYQEKSMEIIEIESSDVSVKVAGESDIGVRVSTASDLPVEGSAKQHPMPELFVSCFEHVVENISSESFGSLFKQDISMMAPSQVSVNLSHLILGESSDEDVERKRQDSITSVAKIVGSHMNVEMDEVSSCTSSEGEIVPKSKRVSDTGKKSTQKSTRPGHLPIPGRVMPTKSAPTPTTEQNHVSVQVPHTHSNVISSSHKLHDDLLHKDSQVEICMSPANSENSSKASNEPSLMTLSTNKFFQDLKTLQERLDEIRGELERDGGVLPGTDDGHVETSDVFRCVLHEVFKQHDASSGEDKMPPMLVILIALISTEILYQEKSQHICKHLSSEKPPSPTILLQPYASDFYISCFNIVSESLMSVSLDSLFQQDPFMMAPSNMSVLISQHVLGPEASGAVRWTRQRSFIQLIKEVTHQITSVMKGHGSLVGIHQNVPEEGRTTESTERSSSSLFSQSSLGLLSRMRHELEADDDVVTMSEARLVRPSHMFSSMLKCTAEQHNIVENAEEKYPKPAFLLALVFAEILYQETSEQMNHASKPSDLDKASKCLASPIQLFVSCLESVSSILSSDNFEALSAKNQFARISKELSDLILPATKDKDTDIFRRKLLNHLLRAVDSQLCLTSGRSDEKQKRLASLEKLVKESCTKLYQAPTSDPSLSDELPRDPQQDLCQNDYSHSQILTSIRQGLLFPHSTEPDLREAGFIQKLVDGVHDKLMRSCHLDKTHISQGHSGVGISLDHQSHENLTSESPGHVSESRQDYHLQTENTTEGGPSKTSSTSTYTVSHVDNQPLISAHEVVSESATSPLPAGKQPRAPQNSSNQSEISHTSEVPPAELLNSSLLNEKLLSYLSETSSLASSQKLNAQWGGESDEENENYMKYCLRKRVKHHQHLKSLGRRDGGSEQTPASSGYGKHETDSGYFASSSVLHDASCAASSLHAATSDLTPVTAPAPACQQSADAASRNASPPPTPFAPLAASTPVSEQHGQSSPTKKTSELRTALFDKEVMESQLRKLQLENSTLQTENKLLKDKHNRAQARIEHLESQLLASQQEAESLQEDFNKAIALKSRDSHDANVESYEEQIESLTQHVEQLKSENVSLQKHLHAGARKTISNSDLETTDFTDRSPIINSFLIEIKSLKSEVSHMRDLLSDAERARQAEALSRAEMSQQLVKLTEMKTLLQQELEKAGVNSAATKQIRSLETRLKITEDRLHQERSDRAGKLCDVEEKLLHGNARLEVAKKELKRQLAREKERHQNTEHKYKEAKSEADHLRALLMERPGLCENSETMAKLTSLRAALSSEKVMQDEWESYEGRINTYKDMVEDVAKQREDLDNIYKSQLQEILQSKHSTEANLLTLRDMNEAISAQNESLLAGLRSASPAPFSYKNSDSQTLQAKMEALRAELQDVKGNLGQVQRSKSSVDIEISSLRQQMYAKQRALDDALEQLTFRGDQASMANHQQKKIDLLNVEIQSLQGEVKLWRQKCDASRLEQNRMELRLATVSRQHHLPVSYISEPSESQTLKSEVEEKDFQVLELTVQISETKDDLQKVKVELQRQTGAREQLAEQMDQLQAELRQKIHLLEQMTGAESNSNTNLRALAENLSTANHELTQRTAQLRLANIELERSNDKVSQLESALADRDRKLSQNMAQLLHEGQLSSAVYGQSVPAPHAAVSKEMLTESEAKVRILRYEKDAVNSDLKRAHDAMDAIVKENAELLARIRETQQELVKERAQLCQTTTEKVEAEQKLRICIEERDELIREKDHLLSDHARNEVETVSVIQRLEMDHKKSAMDYKKRYHSLDTEGKKMAAELATSERLLQAREKEIALLRDTIEHQKREVGGLGRQIEVLKNENSTSRGEVDKANHELTAKMKEYSATSEMTQILTNEKSKLQMEKYQLQQDLGKERSEVQRLSVQINELNRKIHQLEDKQHGSEKQLHQRETKLVAMETELKHSNRGTLSLENERGELKNQIEKLNAELRRVSSYNSTLEERLNLEKASLVEEKKMLHSVQEELEHTRQQLDVFKSECNMMTAALQSEKNTIINLKEQCQHEEGAVINLDKHMRTQKLEIETLKRHIIDSKNTIDQLKKDKTMLYQDVQELCRKLSDKDEELSRVQATNTTTLESLEQNHSTEKTNLGQQRLQLEEELATARSDIESMTERLRHKELQLDAYMRTRSDLDEEMKARHEISVKLDETQRHLDDCRKTVTDLQMENKMLNEQLKQTKLNLTKHEEMVEILNTQLTSQRDKLTSEVNELKQMLLDDNNKHHEERTDLLTKYNKTLTELRANQASLAAAVENRDSLSQTSKRLETTLADVRGQLNDEVTSRKLAEQRVESLHEQLEQIELTKAGSGERASELQVKLARTEAERALAHDKLKTLEHKLNETTKSRATFETQANTLNMQVSELQVEVTSIRGHLESYRQSSSGKNKRLSLELKQQMETFETERSKLIQQTQQLSLDLEMTRQQITVKNQENLSLTEQRVTLEARCSDLTTQVKQVNEQLRGERETRERLDLRNHELELQLSRVRSRGDGDSDTLDNTRMEVNRMVTELSSKMKQQLEAQKNAEREVTHRNAQQISDMKKKVACLESSLSQEQAMHIITKTQLASVEDDNQRLRFQIASTRKRHLTGSEESRSKSRIEEINEIIARSQTRAQQMLAAGLYGEDGMRALSPRSPHPEFMAPFYPSASTPMSPDRRSSQPSE